MCDIPCPKANRIASRMEWVLNKTIWNTGILEQNEFRFTSKTKYVSSMCHPDTSTYSSEKREVV